MYDGNGKLSFPDYPIGNARKYQRADTLTAECRPAPIPREREGIHMTRDQEEKELEAVYEEVKEELQGAGERLTI